MTFHLKTSLTLVGLLGITLMGFQNCSNVNFEKDPNSPAFDYRFESVSPDDQIVTIMDDSVMLPGVDPVGGDGEKQRENDQEQDVVENDDDKDYGKKDDVVKNESHDKKDDVVKGNEVEKEKKDRDVASEDKKSNDLVECQLIDSKELVVLAAKFQQQRSNSSKTRVCMSKQACLTLVNAHVAARDGKLVGAKTTEGSNKQCTKEFPGSKGTCHNADALTDAEVAEMLASMSN